MNNVENKNSPKMIIGFVIGLFAGVIGVLFAQYIVGVDEPENISNTQQSEMILNDPPRCIYKCWIKILTIVPKS